MKLNIRGKLKYEALSQNLAVEDVLTYLKFCEVDYVNYEDRCFSKSYNYFYNRKVDCNKTKDFIAQIKENVKYAFVLKQGDLVVLETSDSDYEAGFFIIENHVVVVKDLRKIFEVCFEKQAWYDEKDIKNLKLNGFSSNSHSICNWCGDKYLVRFFNTGFCDPVCTLKGMMNEKDICKVCKSEGEKHTFIQGAVCSLYCREFANHPAAKWLEQVLGLSKESLDKAMKNSEEEGVKLFCKASTLRDIYERKDDISLLTLEEVNFLSENGQVLVFDNKLEVFHAKPRLKKRKEKLCDFSTKYDAHRLNLPSTKNEAGCYSRCRVAEQELRLETYGFKEGLDNSENVNKHEHQCFSCGLVYEHSHNYKNLNHPQFLKQCGNPDCFMWGLNSKKQKIIMNEMTLIEEAECAEISSLNIVIRKPIFSLAPLENYNPKFLGKRYRSKYTKEEYLELPNCNKHPTLAFERWYLERELYTNVVTKPHYMMAGAPLRTEKYDIESHISVPIIIPDDEKRQQELRKTKHKNFCDHQLEYCDCVKKYDTLTGVHTLYYFNKEIMENIRNINYIALVAHIFIDALAIPEVEFCKVDEELNMEMKVKGNHFSYKHKHPVEALKLISKEFNIFIIGELQSTQLLWCVRKEKSLVRSDFYYNYVHDQFRHVDEPQDNGETFEEDLSYD